MARPSDLPKWNETEERVLAPNTTQEQTGFVFSGTKFEKPKGELFNYLLNNTYKWIKHFDEDGVNTKLFDVASGTANEITLTIPSITSYEENTLFMFKATADNTGATTVNVNSLGAVAVVINNVALTAGQIENGKEYFLRYSSNSNFELVAVGGALDIDGLIAKTTPVDTDTLVLNDSVDSNTLKKLSWANLKNALTDADLFAKPNKNTPLFTKVNPSTLRIPAGFAVAVGEARIALDLNYDLSLNSDLVIPEVKTAGTDYYVYAKSDASFYLSSNDGLSDKLIGGFHYGLTEEAEAISGNKTEADMVKIRGINAYSFWDLKYFAKCGNNRGMFCNGIAWYDIYLADTEYGINGYSRPFSQIAGGGTDFGRGYPKIPLQFGGNGTVNYGKLTPFVAYDLAISVKKDLIGYKEFTDIAYGVQEGLSQAEPVLGQNGHIPALTSKYGMELATGNQYIWSSEIGSSTASGWSNIADARGQVYTNAYVAPLGGARGYSAGVSGSRCSNWYSTLSYSDWGVGCRSRSDLIILD